MNKLKYVGLIVGTIVGLVIAKVAQPDLMNLLLPVPLGIIGFGIGALFSRSEASSKSDR